MAKIFISYRREDSQHAVDRLQEAMRPYLKNPKRDLFVDVDNIPIGVDFEEHLQSKVSQCDAVLAVIGPNWLMARGPDGGRRLDKQDDFVRTEIESALKRNIAVVPVLLDGTPMPRTDQLPDSLQALVKRNGAQLDRKSFRADVEHIMSGLGFRLTRSAWPKVIGGLGVAAAAVGLGVFGFQQFEQRPLGEAEPAAVQDPEFAFAGVPVPDETDLAFSNPRNALIARYQIALTQIAYYDGPIDGEPSDMFHDATKLFSSNYDLTNLGLDFANLDAIERQVLFAEDLAAETP